MVRREPYRGEAQAVFIDTTSQGHRGYPPWFLTLLNVDPALDGLRADPRFPPLVERVGLAKR